MRRATACLLLTFSVACSSAPSAPPAEAGTLGAFEAFDAITVSAPGSEAELTLSPTEVHALIRDLDHAFATAKRLSTGESLPTLTAPAMVLRLSGPHGERELQVLGPQDAIVDVEQAGVLVGPFSFLLALFDRLHALGTASPRH